MHMYRCNMLHFCTLPYVIQLSGPSAYCLPAGKEGVFEQRRIETRPLDELLRLFCDLLPRKMSPRVSHASELTVPDDGAELAPSLQFEVAQLNVAALQDMAGIKIVWVDALSAHLAFDAATLSLSLFKCPSFCKLHRSSRSILDM